MAKKIFILLSILVLTTNIYSQKLRTQILDFAKETSKDGYYILTNVGNYKFEKFCDDKNLESIIDDFATIVHESCHFLNYNMGMNEPIYNEAYYIKDQIFIFVQRNKIFNSNNINKIVPSSISQKIFRYEDYINDNRVSSNVSGIFGLLDEFSAYYQSLKVRNDMHNYYLTQICKGYQNVDEWQTYFQNTSSYITPYYEFNLFIAWYIQYAQKYETSIYQTLLENKNLRIAYTLLNNCFEQELETYNKNLYTTIEQLQKKGFDVRIDGKDEKYLYYYTKEGNGSGVGLYIKEQEFLNDILQQPQNQQILEEFKIQGVNIENYKQHLE